MRSSTEASQGRIGGVLVVGARWGSRAGSGACVAYYAVVAVRSQSRKCPRVDFARRLTPRRPKNASAAPTRAAEAAEPASGVRATTRARATFPAPKVPAQDGRSDLPRGYDTRYWEVLTDFIKVVRVTPGSEWRMGTILVWPQLPVYTRGAEVTTRATGPRSGF